MRKIAGLLALGAMVGFGPAAGAITTDGNWSDWFTYGGNTGVNTWNENLVTVNGPGIRTQNDEEGPTPGGGGQKYDIEQIFYKYEDSDLNALTGGILHIGLVSGFPPEGRPLDNYYAGDMFIDFGNTGTYAVAVATSTSATNADDPSGVDSDYFGRNYTNDGSANWLIRDPVLFVASGPWRVARTPAIENLFTSNVAWGQVGAHYFLEIGVAVDGGLEDVLTNPDGGVGLHWTMECGNDVIDVHDDTPLEPTPQIPIPEPSTFTLLGLGIAGAALRKKFIARDTVVNN